MVPLGYYLHYLALKDAVRTESALTDVLANEDSLEGIGLTDVILMARAQFFELKGEYAKALEIWEPHAKANPIDGGVPIHLGRCYRKQGRFKDAKALLTKAITRISYNGEANYEMAMALAETGEKEKAVSFLEQALKIWANADANFKPAQEARKELEKLQAP